MKPINRTTTLIYKKGRRVKVEKYIKRIYYPDHNNPKVLKPIITEPKDAKIYYTGYKHEIIDHDLLIGFSPKYNDLPFLRFTDPKTENTWALWIKGFGKNIPKTGIRPKSIGKLKYGMHYEIDPNVELKFEVLGHMIRKIIVVHKRPEWNEITFIISRFGGHLITGKTFGKSEPLLAFRKNDIKPLFKFLRPTVYDSSEPLKYHKPMLFLNNIRTGVWELKIKLSEKWLDEAKYPIYIDPTITLQPDATEGYDAYMRSCQPNWNYGVCIGGELGSWGYGLNFGRFLLKFDLSDVTGNVMNAELEITQSNSTWGNFYGYNQKQLTPYRLLNSWAEGNRCNSTAATGESCWTYRERPTEWNEGGAGGHNTDRVWPSDDDPTPVGVVNRNEKVQIDVTNTIKAIRTADNNYGFLLVGWEEGEPNFDGYEGDHVNGYALSDYSTVSYRPKLTIEYDDIYWHIGRVGWEGEERPFVWIFD